MAYTPSRSRYSASLPDVEPAPLPAIPAPYEAAPTKPYRSLTSRTSPTSSGYTGYTGYGTANQYGRGQGAVDDGAAKIMQALSIYDAAGAQRPTPNVRSYGVSSQDEYNANKARMGQESAGWSSARFTAAGSGPGYHGGGGGGAAAAPQMQAIPLPPAPNMPDLKLPEYSPPGEDPSVYKQAREEAMRPGLRALQTGLREGIMSAGTLDNPNARSEFVRDALRGYGEGLEKVSSGAGREARAEAGRQRSEQMQIYQAKYSAQTEQARANYQNQINKIAQDYANMVTNMQSGAVQTTGAGGSMAQLARQGRDDYINRMRG